MRKFAAEFLGTLLLVATVVGSGVMGETLAAGNAAIALLANTIATAAMLFVLITIFGAVSGAHFNPAVTAVFLARGEIAAGAAGAYALAQVAGGIAGAMGAHAMFALDILQVGSTVRAGAGQLLGEAVATFALVLTILGAVRHRPDQVAAAVALVITAGYWFTSSTSFANPAVTIARALSDSFAGIRPVDALGFIGAQAAGAALAAAAGRVFFGNAAPVRQA
jgi:glycerol uptake facilitator-like aquaporin